MRNVSPADERRPQGLRTYIDTFPPEGLQQLFREKLRPLRPVPQQFRKKLARHTPVSSISGTKLALHTPSHRMCGTKLALRTPSHCMRGTKLALLAQNGPIWRVLTAHGELSTAVTTNKPRRANFVPNTSWMRE